MRPHKDTFDEMFSVYRTDPNHRYIFRNMYRQLRDIGFSIVEARRFVYNLLQNLVKRGDL